MSLHIMRMQERPQPENNRPLPSTESRLHRAESPGDDVRPHSLPIHGRAPSSRSVQPRTDEQVGTTSKTTPPPTSSAKTKKNASSRKHHHRHGHHHHHHKTEGKKDGHSHKKNHGHHHRKGHGERNGNVMGEPKDFQYDDIEMQRTKEAHQKIESTRRDQDQKEVRSFQGVKDNEMKKKDPLLPVRNDLDKKAWEKGLRLAPRLPPDAERKRMAELRLAPGLHHEEMEEKRTNAHLDPPLSLDVEEKKRAQVVGNRKPSAREEVEKNSERDGYGALQMTHPTSNRNHRPMSVPLAAAPRTSNPTRYSPSSRMHVQPGAIREGGTLDDDEETAWGLPLQDEEAPFPDPLHDNPAITTATLVKEQDVVPALPELPWIRQRRNQWLLLALTLLLVGLTAGLVIPLTSNSENTTSLTNDFCQHALSLPVPSSATVGSTMSATSDNVDPCGSASGGSVLGIWYSVLGTGHTLSVSTCNNSTSFDTQISVFSGDCDKLQCTSGNSNCRVSWVSDIGETYRVIVHGRDGSTGNFLIDVEDLGPPLEGDLCESSIGPLLVPSSERGSTRTATSEFVEDCGGASGSHAPGLWYRVVGTGTVLSVSTCNDETTFGTQISVFSGSCTGLQCINGNDNACGFQSRVDWISSVGSSYFVLVRGSEGQTGDFRLDIDDLGPPLDGDYCENAIGPVAIPSYNEGSTNNATIDFLDFTYEGRKIPLSAIGIWYRVEGTGNVMSASTCNDATTLNTQIVVFTGTCNKLQIVAYDDDTCGSQSYLTGIAYRGTTYYVFVHGYPEGVRGDFQLDFEDLGPPVKGDLCEDAIGPLAIPSSTEGSTAEGATVSFVETCGENTIWTKGIAPGLWYKVIGTGKVLSVSTCNDATDFNTQLSVFFGSCDGLLCVDGNNDACQAYKSRINWASELGATYFILVDGFYETGKFTLDITEV